MAMLVRFLGPGLVLLFAVSQAFRDVYFAHVFQGVDVFAVVLLAFSISAVGFGVVALLRAPQELAIVRAEWQAMLWMNITTALAWTSYFYSLKHLQPSIVNTLHSGIGPLTVLALSAFGWRIAKPSAVRKAEYVCYAGLASSLAFLWWVVLAGHSGLDVNDLATNVTALALLIVSGACITISLLLCKRLNDRGVGSDSVTAGRYILIVLVAFAAVLFRDTGTGISSLQQWTVLGIAATILIVLPLYSLQLGIARTAPLTAHVIRSLGPVCVFALELFDRRIGYSGLTLFGIALYSVFSIASNLARGWGGEHNVNALRPSATA
jgi:drug/metabolite transporter (DMT)-like permease